MIIIVGVKHDFERDVTDKDSVGKNFIFKVLEQHQPELILLENGFDYASGKPSEQPSLKCLHSYYAVEWANKNNIRYKFIDYEKTIDSNSWNGINLIREKYFANELMRTNNKVIVGFFGENHRSGIIKYLKDREDIISFKMPWITLFEIIWVKVTEPIKFSLKNIFH